VSEPRLSSATKGLLRAAREDGPSAAARAKVWSGVSGAVGGAAGLAGGAGPGAGASSAAVAGTTGVAKMLVLGTLLGGAVTVGLAAVLLRIGPAPSPPSSKDPLPITAAAPPPGIGALLGADTAGSDMERGKELTANVPPSTPASAPAMPPASPPAAQALRSATRPAGAHAGPPTPSDDALFGQEVSLMVDARAALARGDAAAALRAVRAARALPSHHLAPEELAVEAQALRAAGREDEARDTDSMLRKQFPESFLAR
jgi:hypothetical protein